MPAPLPSVWAGTLVGSSDHASVAAGSKVPVVEGFPDPRVALVREHVGSESHPRIECARAAKVGYDEPELLGGRERALAPAGMRRIERAITPHTTCGVARTPILISPTVSPDRDRAVPPAFYTRYPL
jgi:hypothetical protein